MMLWLLWSALVGVVAGVLAGRLLKGNGFGLLGDIAVGIVGAVVGGHILGMGGMDLGGIAGRLIVAFIGAALLLFIVRLFTGRRNGRRLWS